MSLAKRVLSVEPRTAPAAARRQLGKRRILLVDDDCDALHLTGLILRRAGYDVAEASGGAEALALLADADTVQAPPFDAIITDLAMPGLSGRALLETVFAHAPKLPALLITGYGGERELRALPGRVGILIKPFTRADLLGRIDALFGARDSARRPASPLRESLAEHLTGLIRPPTLVNAVCRQGGDTHA